MSADLYEHLKFLKQIKVVREVKSECLTANGEKLAIRLACKIHFKIEHCSWNFEILVAPQLSCPLILGSDFFLKSRLVLDIFQGTFTFKFYKAKPFNLVNFKNISPPTVSLSSTAQVSENPLGHLDDESQRVISELIEDYPDVLTTELGLTDLIEYHIELKDNIPVKSQPYQLAPPKMQFLREHVRDLEDKGVVEKSISNYSSPVFLVQHPEKKPRMVVDYRKLNQHIVIEAVPLPNLHQCFNWFVGAKYFTVLDLNSAYHQIPLTKGSKHLTSFCTPWMLYQFTRVPFGLCTGAQVLTRLLDQVFSDVKFQYVFNYLDDLVIYSKTWEEHVEHLHNVFSRLRQAKLTVNPEKVRFAVGEISFLGHKVSARGVQIDPERTKAIRNFPRPTNPKAVSRFIGMVNFFAKFIPNFAEHAAPLNLLRRKGQKFAWTQDQDQAFQYLRNAIAQPPVLRMANFDKPFVLQTDASSCALGAVLLQEIDGIRQPIAYASRTLTPAERKASSAYESECLAVVFGVEKFRQYLEHREFLLETDNQALSWLLARPRQLGKLGRWVAKLTSLKFQVAHIRGTQNVIADSLSRMFEPENLPVETDSSPDINIICNSLLTNFPLAFQDISTQQRADGVLKPIISDLESGNISDRYILHKGTLCLKNHKDDPIKIYVPQSLVDLVINYYHDSPVGGHLGIQKTKFKVSEFFYWPTLISDVTRKVRGCNTCAVSKPAQNSRLGYLSSIVPTRPMEKMHIDYVGKLPRTTRGNTMILVAVDQFSKFTWLSPVRDSTSFNTIKSLSQIFQNFGFPKVIISDNATCFTSHSFRNFCFARGIKHATLSPYHPQPNNAERLNRNLKAALIAYHSNNQTSWDNSLSWLQLAFNFANHETLKTSPFKILFNFTPNTPLSLTWNIQDLLPRNNPNPHDIWRQAKNNIFRAHQKSERVYNQGRRPHNFQIGDLVWCKTHNLSSAVDKRAAKLMARWSGPFRILDFLTPVTVSLSFHNSDKFVKKAHVEQLKPHLAPTDPINHFSRLNTVSSNLIINNYPT